MSVIEQRLTYRDLEQFPNDGKRREIIQGKLYVFAAPARPHQKLLVRFTVRLAQWADETGAGEVYIAPVDVVLDEETEVQPDLIFIRRERLDIYRGHRVCGPPDLVLEILSPATCRYDETEKAGAYAAAGVPEYWLADPLAPSFRPFVLRAGRYEPIPLSPDGRFCSPTLSGLALDLPPLLAGLDPGADAAG